MNVSAQAQRLREHVRNAWSGEGSLMELSNPGPGGARVILGIVLPVGAVLVAALPWMVFWNRLPDPVATRWDLAGDANAHMSPLSAALLFVGLVVVLGVSVAAATRLVSSRPSNDASRGGFLLGVLVFAMTLMAVASGLTVAANIDVASWRATHLGLGWVLALVLFSLTQGELGAALARRLALTISSEPIGEADRAGSAVDRPTVDLAAGERVAWVGACGSRVLSRLGAGLVVGAAVFGVLSPVGGLTVWAVLLGTGLALVVVASVRVTVGAHGVRVHPGMVRWPSVVFPLNSIGMASAIDVGALEWGGWGYRGSIRVFRRAAWVVRQGEGLRLDLTDGCVFAVTVDDAETAAAVLNDLLSRA